jgi:hypothetical protein
MVSYYIMRRSNLTQGQVAQVGNVFSTFSVIMASPLSALLKRMISFFEPDIELYINNLSNYVEGNTFKSLGSKLGQRFNRTK